MVSEKELTPSIFASRISDLLRADSSDKPHPSVSSLDSRHAAQQLAELLHQLVSH